MSYDFYAEKYGRPNIHEWNQYTILKCTKIGDKQHYPKSIRKYYKTKQIDKYWEFTNWFIPSAKDIPNSSILLKVHLKPKKQFVSRDDEQFWPNPDNPLCKDKVLKVPLVRPSSWKGSLRYVVRDVMGQSNATVERLFGNEKGDEKSKRGRLTFFPSFLDDIDLDVIAPHDRKTKAPVEGRSPIQFEIVPEDAEGVFSLLYFPFDLIGDEEKLRKETSEDLEILKEAVPAMLTKYGFGAKTTSGYGVIEDKVKFQILPKMKSEETDEYFSDKEKSKFVQKIDSVKGVSNE